MKKGVIAVIAKSDEAGVMEYSALSLVALV